MVGWMENMVGWIEKKIDGQLDGKKNRKNRWMVWMDRKNIIIKKMDGWMDKKIDGWLDG